MKGRGASKWTHRLLRPQEKVKPLCLALTLHAFATFPVQRCEVSHQAWPLFQQTVRSIGCREREQASESVCEREE